MKEAAVNSYRDALATRFIPGKLNVFGVMHHLSSFTKEAPPLTLYLYFPLIDPRYEQKMCFLYTEAATSTVLFKALRGPCRLTRVML